jgi:hypothetical protein
MTTSTVTSQPPVPIVLPPITPVNPFTLTTAQLLALQYFKIYGTAPSSTGPDTTPHSVVIAPATIVLSSSASVNLSFTVFNAEGIALLGQTVTWAVSNPAFSISTSGAISTTTPSQAGTVTATVVGYSSVQGTAAVTSTASTTQDVIVQPPADAVASGVPAQLVAASFDNFNNRTSAYVATNPPAGAVGVTPQNWAVTAGGTVQLSAKVYDVNAGQNISQAVTWGQPTPSIATVSSSGLVTGVSAGTAIITATSGSVVGGSLGTVSASGGGGGSNTPNQPAGLTKITERFFQAVSEDGWANVNSTGADLSIVTDSTNPLGNPKVAQIQFLTTLPQGEEPQAQQERTPQIQGVLGRTAQQLYTCTWIRFSPNWVQSAAGMQKIYYIWTMENGVEQDASVYMTFQQTTQGWYPTYGVQDAVIKNYGPNVSGQTGITINWNQWTRYETYSIMNTPGNANGTSKIWINGTLVSNWTTMQMLGATGGIYKSQFAPYYGGNGGSPPANQQMFLAYHYESAA